MIEYPNQFSRHSKLHLVTNQGGIDKDMHRFGLKTQGFSPEPS